MWRFYSETFLTATNPNAILPQQIAGNFAWTGLLIGESQTTVARHFQNKAMFIEQSLYVKVNLVLSIILELKN